jgi:flagellin
MSVINTNITSMIGQSNLNKSQNALQTSMERLSSGLRINSAKDDAAGQAIANRMTSQITGLSQAQRNANDGISVAQTAEGALNQVNDNLQRIRELTVQAANGTNSANDLQSIQDEIGQRLSEIDRISEETNFNGVRVLASDRGLNIQVGANDGETITVNLKEITAETLKLDQFRVTQNALNTSGPVQFVDVGSGNFAQADLSLAATSLSQLLGESVNVNDLTLREVQAADGSGTGTGTFAIEYKGNMYAAEQQAQTGNANAENFTVSAVMVDGTAQAVQLGINVDPVSGAASNVGFIQNADGDFEQVTLAANRVATAMNPATDAATAVANSSATYVAGTAFNGAATTNPLEKLDEALKNVDSLRSELGAVQNRFESAITNLQTNETNLAAARSRIEDADYASEVANMTRAQILQQAGTSVLAQANQIPQNVLSLLG